MLYLARKVDEDIFVTDLNGKVLLRLVVAKARSGEVSIAFDEFTEVKVWRGELHRKIQKENAITKLRLGHARANTVNK